MNTHTDIHPNTHSHIHTYAHKYLPYTHHLTTVLSPFPPPFRPAPLPQFIFFPPPSNSFFLYPFSAADADGVARAHPSH